VEADWLRRDGADVISELRIACNVCESGAVVEQFKHIVFAEGTLRAFNGVVSVQAPSAFDPTCPAFAVKEERVLQALSACAGDDIRATLSDEFLVLKPGKLTVRIRRLPPEGIYSDAIVPPAKLARVPALGLQDAIRAVAPFMSDDASRPWTTAILIRDGFAWATNNLSLVKFPLALPLDNLRIPAPAVPVLLMLPSIDWVNVNGNRIVMGCGKLLVSFPMASAEWPAEIGKFFDGAPKTLPMLAPELRDAARVVEKFAERFIVLTPDKIAGKLATIESEYEIAIPNGKGIYPAKLMLLVLAHATHADFSTYPAPIFFAGPKLRGVAVGARQEQQA
jgi:hypothetical protein